MRNNLGLKIVALVVAILIWMQVSVMSDHQSKVNLDLKLTNRAESDTLPETLAKVPCIVQGRGLDIIKLVLSRTYLTMDAADLKAGNLKDFEAVDLPANLNLTLVGIDPSVERKLSGLKLEGQPPPQNPSAAKRKADKQGKKAGKEKPDLDATDPVNSLVLTNIPISGSGERRFFPSVVTLKVRGRNSALASLPKGINVTVSASPDARGLYSVEAATPEGVTLQDITPKQVRLGK